MARRSMTGSSRDSREKIKEVAARRSREDNNVSIGKLGNPAWPEGGSCPAWTGAGSWGMAWERREIQMQAGLSMHVQR